MRHASHNVGMELHVVALEGAHVPHVEQLRAAAAATAAAASRAACRTSKAFAACTSVSYEWHLKPRLVRLHASL
jgi:hypothetical protein